MHDHGQGGVDKRVLLEILTLNAVFFAVELIGGLWSRSLALVADAGHMLSDAGALGLALLAAWFASRPATPEKSYGFYRAEILAALANGVGLIAIGVYVFVEAVRRATELADVRGGVMLPIAIAGLVVNVYSWRRLHADQSLNLRAASLHMRADAIGSIGAIVAGVLVVTLGWNVADVVVGVVVAVLIAVGARVLVRDAVNVLLEATPSSISLPDVRDAIATADGVIDVHDLHVWTLTSGYVALSAHVVVPDAASTQTRLVELRSMLDERFGIDHATLQMETPDLTDERMHCTDDPRCL